MMDKESRAGNKCAPLMLSKFTSNVNFTGFFSVFNTVFSAPYSNLAFSVFPIDPTQVSKSVIAASL